MDTETGVSFTRVQHAKRYCFYKFYFFSFFFVVQIFLAFYFFFIFAITSVCIMRLVVMLVIKKLLLFSDVAIQLCGVKRMRKEKQRRTNIDVV